MGLQYNGRFWHGSSHVSSSHHRHCEKKFCSLILETLTHQIDWIWMRRVHSEGFVVSKNWHLLVPILSRRLLGRERDPSMILPFSRDLATCRYLLDPCPSGGIIPGASYRINQVSWQLRLVTGSLCIFRCWGGRRARPSTTQGAGAPCTALQGTSLLRL